MPLTRVWECVSCRVVSCRAGTNLVRLLPCIVRPGANRPSPLKGKAAGGGAASGAVPPVVVSADGLASDPPAGVSAGGVDVQVDTEAIGGAGAGTNAASNGLDRELDPSDIGPSVTSNPILRSALLSRVRSRSHVHHHTACYVVHRPHPCNR